MEPNVLSSRWGAGPAADSLSPADEALLAAGGALSDDIRDVAAAQRRAAAEAAGARQQPRHAAARCEEHAVQRVSSCTAWGRIGDLHRPFDAQPPSKGKNRSTGFCRASRQLVLQDDEQLLDVSLGRARNAMLQFDNPRLISQAATAVLLPPVRRAGLASAVGRRRHRRRRHVHYRCLPQGAAWLV